MIVTLDTTLREGELQPGVYYTKEARITIGKALAEAGTRRIELPIVYPSRGGVMEEIKDVVSGIQQNYTDSMAVIHARALKKDIELANSYEAQGCAIYMAPTKRHRREKFHGIGQDKAIEMYVNALDFVRSCGFKYRRATIEDASRFALHGEKSEEDTFEFLRELMDAIKNAGATVISIPDTSGILPLNRCVSFLKRVSGMTDIPLACHFHNDYGNSLGNALQAITVPGIEEIHVSILGLGTRNGITDHYEFVANLEDFFDISSGEKRERMRWLYNTFVKATGIPIPWNHPLSPQCFVEKAGTHQSQVVKDPAGYLPRRKLQYDSSGPVLFEAGQLMSKQLIIKLFEGHKVSSELIEEVTNAIAARSALRKRKVLPLEVKEIIYAISGIDLPIVKINAVIKGVDLVYILLNLKPQAPIREFLEEVGSWNEIERVDEVYGNVDLVVLSQIRDVEGNAMVDKIRNRFKDIITNAVSLLVE